jgi:hypothetical protein
MYLNSDGVRGMLKMGKASENGSPGSEVEASRHIDIVLAPECGELVFRFAVSHQFY